MPSSLQRVRRRSAIVINLTSIFERADESLLPAMYKYISKDFHASPSELGAITVSRSLTQALTSPIGGVLGSMVNRIRVIFMGCLLWATMTWLFGIARWAPQPFVMGAIVWALNGLGLSLVIPNSQSVIADFYTAEHRGRAFGLLYLNGSMGAVLGSLFATNLSSWNTDVLRGWQLVMFVLAILSGLIGWLNIHYARDPRDAHLQSQILGEGEEEQRILNELSSDAADGEEEKSNRRPSWSEIYTTISAVFQIPTFCIIILQGVVGSMPWKVLAAFGTLYLQLIGMPDYQAAAVFSSFLVGTALGGLLGGIVGDRASLWSPNHGRIFACQFSVIVGIPLILLIFRCLPRNGAASTALLYSVVFFSTGLLISWAAPSCNNPIFAEIVPPASRNLIYAFDRCLEDALASPGSFLAGLAAEKIWGFTGDATSTEDTEKDLEKADALAHAMTWFSVIPWTACAIFYSGLHFTYKRDKHQRIQN